MLRAASLQAPALNVTPVSPRPPWDRPRALVTEEQRGQCWHSRGTNLPGESAGRESCCKANGRAPLLLTSPPCKPHPVPMRPWDALTGQQGGGTSPSRGRRPASRVYILLRAELPLQTAWRVRTPPPAQGFAAMSPSHGPSLRRFYKAPSLAAIEHAPRPVSLGSGLVLPSSCHGRTWLLDPAGEAQGGIGSGRVPDCLPGAAQTPGAHAGPCERPRGPSGSAAAESKCTSQPRLAGKSRPPGPAIQGCPPGATKRWPPKTDVPPHPRMLDCESSQGPTQGPDSRPCRPLVLITPEPQPPEPSAAGCELTCCVTGGWQLPRK